MNKETVRKDAIRLYNECITLGLNNSYKSVLETMYETANENKNYLKASLINDLIIEETNN